MGRLLLARSLGVLTVAGAAAALSSAGAAAVVPAEALVSAEGETSSALLAAAPDSSSHARRELAPPGLLDAAANRVPSTESSFDHMLDLSPEGTVRLHFHWNDPTSSGSGSGSGSGMFEARLIHRAPASETDAGWLGVGIYDVPKNGVPESGDNVMIGSHAIIGRVQKRDVAKYSLGGKTLGAGGVEKLPMSFQTLVPTATSISQHSGDDGHVNTILSFEKMLKEMDDEEIEILENDHNVLLYAVGPHAGDGEESNLGMHVLKGALKLNFADVKEKAKNGGGGGGGGSSELDSSGGSSNAALGGGANADDYAAVDALNKCQSDDTSYLHMIHLAPGLKLNYDLDVWSDDDPPTISIKLTYDAGSAWLGFGISPDGNMIGSEAIIGRPDLARADGEKPLKYRLKGKGTTAVVPMDGPQQTLRDASIENNDGKTIMKFKKLLREEGQHTIEPAGMMNFIYAVGSGDALAYHKHKGSFRIDLSKCVSPDAYDPTSTSNAASSSGGTSTFHSDHPPRVNRSGWVAHGVLAALAWAVTAPFAVTVAWFRTLVPSSWIYVHVFSNVSTFLLTLVSFITAVVTMSSEPDSTHFTNLHHVIGLAMLLLATFQVMNGFLRPPVERRDPYAVDRPPSALAVFLRLPDTARGLWKLSHRIVGAILLGFGMWQIATGCDLFSWAFTGGVEASWKPYFYFYLILFGTILIGLRGWMWWEESRARRNVDMMNPDQRQMGSLAVASGVDPNSELVPVQFDVRIQ